MDSASRLRRHALIARLSAPRAARILAAVRIEPYEKGAVIFRQGERAADIWIVQEGWVHLVRSSAGGEGARAVVIFTVTPDEALCGLSAIDAGIYTMSAVAGTACRLMRIPGRLFREALRHEAAFAHEVVRLCVRRIRHIAEQYGSMAEPVSGRIIRTIFRLRRQFGPTIPITHRELAQMSWTTTESAIRVVRRLKAQGYVTGTRGRLRIGDAHALEQVLGQANGRHASAGGGRAAIRQAV